MATTVLASQSISSASRRQPRVATDRGPCSGRPNCSPGYFSGSEGLRAGSSAAAQRRSVTP